MLSIILHGVNHFFLFTTGLQITQTKKRIEFCNKLWCNYLGRKIIKLIFSLSFVLLISFSRNAIFGLVAKWMWYRVTGRTLSYCFLLNFLKCYKIWSIIFHFKRAFVLNVKLNKNIKNKKDHKCQKRNILFIISIRGSNNLGLHQILENSIIMAITSTKFSYYSKLNRDKLSKANSVSNWKYSNSFKKYSMGINNSDTIFMFVWMCVRVRMKNGWTVKETAPWIVPECSWLLLACHTL